MWKLRDMGEPQTWTQTRKTVTQAIETKTTTIIKFVMSAVSLAHLLNKLFGFKQIIARHSKVERE